MGCEAVAEYNDGLKYTNLCKLGTRALSLSLDIVCVFRHPMCYWLSVPGCSDVGPGGVHLFVNRVGEAVDCLFSGSRTHVQHDLEGVRGAFRGGTAWHEDVQVLHLCAFGIAISVDGVGVWEADIFTLRE